MATCSRVGRPAGLHSRTACGHVDDCTASDRGAREEPLSISRRRNAGPRQAHSICPPSEPALSIPKSLHRTGRYVKSEGAPAREVVSTRTNSCFDVVEWVDKLQQEGKLQGDLHCQASRLAQDFGADFDAFESILRNSQRVQDMMTTRGRKILLEACRHRRGEKECEDSKWARFATKLSARFKTTRGLILYLGAAGTVSHGAILDLFTSMGHPEMSDMFWEQLSKDRHGQARMNEILSRLGHYILPGYPAADKPQGTYPNGQALDNWSCDRRAQVRDIAHQFAEKVQAKFRTLRDVWCFLDHKRAGHASVQSCVYLFQELSLDPAWGRMLCEYLDETASGVVTYNELRDLMDPFVRPEFTGKHVSRISAREDMPQDVRDALDYIGKKAAEKFRSIRDCFRKMRGGSNLHVTRDEFADWVEDMLLHRDCAYSVFDYMDLSNRGDLNFSTINYLLGPYITSQLRDDYAQPSRDPRWNLDPRVRQVLMEFGKHIAMAAKYKNIREVFKGINRSGEGGIDREEFGEYCRSNGISEKVANVIFDFMDVSGSGSVSYAELVNTLGFYIRAFERPLEHHDELHILRSDDDDAASSRSKNTTAGSVTPRSERVTPMGTPHGSLESTSQRSQNRCQRGSMAARQTPRRQSGSSRSVPRSASARSSRQASYPSLQSSRSISGLTTCSQSSRQTARQPNSSYSWFSGEDAQPGMQVFDRQKEIQQSPDGHGLARRQPITCTTWAASTRKPSTYH